MGLQEQGVELAFDKYNENLISLDLKKELDEIKARIILHEIDLTHYSQINECIHNGTKLF